MLGETLQDILYIVYVFDIWRAIIDGRKNTNKNCYGQKKTWRKLIIGDGQNIYKERIMHPHPYFTQILVKLIMCCVFSWFACLSAMTAQSLIYIFRIYSFCGFSVNHMVGSYNSPSRREPIIPPLAGTTAHPPQTN
jgi:hypothetical protein